MDLESLRDLRVLEAISGEQHVTQRSLAASLGIALGLTNLYVRRLVRKGYIKCINVRSNRLLYLITPKGLTEKTRLTIKYMEYSLRLYGEVRRQMRAVLQPLDGAEHQRVALYGTGEMAELAYLSVKEADLDLTAIFDRSGGRTFLGMPVRDIRDQHLVGFDLLIVAVLEPPEQMVRELTARGVPASKLRCVHPRRGTRAESPTPREAGG